MDREQNRLPVRGDSIGIPSQNGCLKSVLRRTERLRGAGEPGHARRLPEDVCQGPSPPRASRPWDGLPARGGASNGSGKPGSSSPLPACAEDPPFPLQEKAAVYLSQASKLGSLAAKCDFGVMLKEKFPTALGSSDLAYRLLEEVTMFIACMEVARL